MRVWLLYGGFIVVFVVVRSGEILTSVHPRFGSRSRKVRTDADVGLIIFLQIQFVIPCNGLKKGRGCQFGRSKDKWSYSGFYCIYLHVLGLWMETESTRKALHKRSFIVRKTIVKQCCFFFFGTWEKLDEPHFLRMVLPNFWKTDMKIRPILNLILMIWIFTSWDAV